MDDIRRPEHQRRDFAMRHRAHQPRPSVPGPAQTAPAPVAARPPLTAADYQPGLAPAAASETGYEHYSQPVHQPRPRPAAQKRRLPRMPLKYTAAGIAGILLIGAGIYLISQPAQKSGFSVVQLSKKSTFGFYYPQPLPGGYSYQTKINAFQDGQAYFMLAKGSKHIIFHEQAASGQSTGGLTAAKAAVSPAGKALIGTLAGQPAAKVLAGSTFISINTTGAVPAADLSQAVRSLRTDR
jgi:hypothetical protein